MAEAQAQARVRIRDRVRGVFAREYAHDMESTTTREPTAPRRATLEPQILALRLTGTRLHGIETLGGLLEEPSLLVFLRHGG